MIRSRMSHTFVVFISVLGAVGAANRAVGQPTVSFGLQDYAELGFVREAVRSGYEEVNNGLLDVQTALNYSILTAQAVTNASDLTGIGTGVSSAATLYSTLVTLNGVLNAENIEDLVDTLSPLDTSAVTAALGNVQSALQTLNSQTQDVIEPPTLYTYYAVAVSGRARSLVEQLRNDAISGRASLLTALNNILALTVILQQYELQLSQAAMASQELAALLNDLLPIPGVGIVAYSMLINVVAIQGQIYNLRVSYVPPTLSQLGASELRVEQRIGELDDLIVALDFALTAPPLSSSWVTDAIVPSNNPFYNMSFSGRTFGHTYTEIDGRFLLGTLSLTNHWTPPGQGFPPLANIVFNVDRLVNDPVAGPVHTLASVSLDMSYIVTSAGIICGEGRDWFFVPDLGITLAICEYDTRNFAVYGQYDSPLRIVAIEALPSDVDPDPAVVNVAYTLQVTGGTGSGVFEEGQVVGIEAISPIGRRFVSWTGDLEFIANSASAITTVTIPSRNVYVEALFLPERQNFELSVMNGSGAGVYPEATEVGIRAEVPPQFRFTGWLGDIDTIEDPTAQTTFVRMTRNSAVAASFVPRDDCPDDPTKTVPGYCGCGVPDADADSDGVVDCVDACPGSDFSPRILVGGCDTLVANQALSGGCTMTHEIGKAAALARNHGEFVSSVAHITDAWRRDGLITNAERSRIQRCAARASVP